MLPDSLRRDVIAVRALRLAAAFSRAGSVQRGLQAMHGIGRGPWAGFRGMLGPNGTDRLRPVWGDQIKCLSGAATIEYE